MTPLRIEAPAKLNLALAVTGRRAGGMHELVSDLVLLELADRLLLMPGCSGLRVEGDAADGVPVDSANLAWRGLAEGLGHPPRLECLTLDKHVPASAGLGGGSSDAAAAWRLGRTWERKLDEEPPSATILAALARIGADVPFFAAGAVAARVMGIGEVVEPTAADPSTPHVVLVHPPFTLSTAAVFAELRESDWSPEIEPGRNDLLAAARRLRPELDAVFREVAGAGGAPRLTGSGPTVYSLTGDPERADAVARRLERAGLRATLTRLRSQPASIEVVGEDAESEE